MEESKNFYIRFNLCRVLVFRDAPELVYTGLQRNIGKPRDLEKNTEDDDYFNKSDIDLNIPIEETTEYLKAN